MKKPTLLCTVLLLLSAPAFADNHHIEEALDQTNAAVVYGRNGHTATLVEHAKLALEHALAASITAQDESKIHLDVAVEELEEAIELGQSGHVGTATKHAQAALRHIKASHTGHKDK